MTPEPHIIILDDEYDCVIKVLGDLKGTYHALKSYRQTAPQNEHQAIDNSLHDAEHLMENLCQGNNLQGYSIIGCIGAMANLLP